MQVEGATRLFEARSAFDTVSGAARDRWGVHDDWMKFIAQNLFPYRLATSLSNDGAFQLNAMSRSIDGLTIARITTQSGKCRLIREEQDISADSTDRCVVYMPLQGEVQFSQLGRETTLTPSSLILLSAAQALSHQKLGDNDTLCFLMPRAFVDQRLVDAEAKCGRPIGTEQGLTRLVRQSLTAFYESCTTMDEAEFKAAISWIGDLILLAVHGRADLYAPERSIRKATLARVKTVIRNRLGDLDLTLSDIATECSISLSYLHTLFRDDGRTAWEFRNGERLQRARQLLENPPSPSTTVTEVALTCGFSNMSQFSTAFRRAFSVTPRDVLRG